MKKYLILCRLYYGGVGDIDSLDLGDIPLRKRRLGEKRRDKLSLDRIFITGLPQEDANRYYSA